MARPIPDSNDDLLNKGIALFNDGRFFEAHEVWEDAWKRSQGAEKLFYQGLIHAAAAIIHVRRSNSSGAESQFGKCIARLDQVGPDFMGVALDRLIEETRTFIDDNSNGLVGDYPPPKIRSA